MVMECMNLRGPQRWCMPNLALVLFILLILIIQNAFFRPASKILCLHGEGLRECDHYIMVERQQEKASYAIENYPIRGPLAWEVLNEDLQQEFLLHGKVTLEIYEMFNMENFKSGQVVRYNETLKFEWNMSAINSLIAAAKSRDVYSTLCSYGWRCNRDFFAAIEAHPVKDKDVLVVGSQSPWAEAMCIAFGARTVTTVDFNVPELEDAQLIRTLSVEQLGEYGEKFDTLVSYSSLEHDGLGRYGDPLNPYGDIERMKKLRAFLWPGGVLFLGVPMGRDVLQWNSHRVYGRVRFPMLIGGWRLLATFGDLEWDFHYNATYHMMQPVHVLEPLRG